MYADLRVCTVFLLLFSASFSIYRPLFADVATATELMAEMPTYPFSDPDPVPCVAERRYPYFRYDGSSLKSVKKAWKSIILENGKIAVTLISHSCQRIAKLCGLAHSLLCREGD